MKKTNIKLKGKLRRYLNWPLYLTIVLILMDVAMYAQDIQMGAEFSGFIVLYVIIVLISNRRNRPLLINELVNFATQYGTVQKQLLNDFEIPYALLDYNSRFLWMNEKFTEITGKDKNYHKSVTTVFPSLTKDILQKSEAVESINVMLDDRNYRISMKRIYFDSVTKDSAIVAINDSDEYLTAIYLFDETELNRYIRENEEQKLVAGLIYIDNYEEALDSIEDVKRSLLIALVDRKVNKYFTEIDALVRKIEKDKYFVVFKYKYLEQLSADKFKLIEDVKVATVKTGALNFNGTKNAYDQIGTDSEYKYNINSDTTVLYVDTKEKEGKETATFSDADDYNGVYVPNAYYIIDGTDGDDADLSLVIYDVTNKLYNANAVELTLTGSKTGIVATMEDSYNDAVESGDDIGQGNLVTLKLENTTDSAITVQVTITNAVFESGDKATLTRQVTVPANSTNSVSFTVTGANDATVTIA